jgi:hypothetical protein
LNYHLTSRFKIDALLLDAWAHWNLLCGSIGLSVKHLVILKLAVSLVKCLKRAGLESSRLHHLLQRFNYGLHKWVSGLESSVVMLNFWVGVNPSKAWTVTPNDTVGTSLEIGLDNSVMVVRLRLEKYNVKGKFSNFN